MGRAKTAPESTLLESPYFDYAAEVTIARNWEDRAADRWENAEPNLVAVLARLRRAFSKLRRRAVWLALCFVVLATLIAFRLNTRQGVYVAEVKFRVKDPGSVRVEASDKQLADAIRQGYFTHVTLTPLLERHQLYRARYGRAPYLAVESFLEDIVVVATRQEVFAGSGERALSVTVQYSHAEADTAQTVANELAAIVVAESRAFINSKHVLSIRQTNELAEAAFKDATNVYRLPGRIGSIGDTAKGAAVESHFVAAVREKAKAELESTAALADHAYDFLVVNDGVEARGMPMPAWLAIPVGAAIALSAIVVLGILLGAGTAFVIDEKDIRALRMTPLGSVYLPRARA